MIQLKFMSFLSGNGCWMKNENSKGSCAISEYKYYDMTPVIEEVMKNIAEFFWVSRKNVNFVAESY